MSGGGHAGPPPAAAGMAVAAPSHAERARTLCAMQQTGALATLGREPAGCPYASLVSYALDEAGRPLLLLSAMAEHTGNLLADGRGSLLVTEAMVAGVDPLALGRVTLLGRIARLDGEEATAARARFLARHPAAARYVDFKDFAFYRLAVLAVRYIGGFGRMSWVGAEEYAHAEPDPLAPDAGGILAHMNQDHAAALLVYARAWAGLADATAAAMSAVDRYGFEMMVTLPGGARPVRLPFAAPLATAMEARAELVRLAKEGRARLAQ